MSKKKVWECEDQIIQAIDKAYSKAKSLFESADMMESEGREMIRNYKTQEQGKAILIEAKRKRTRASNLIEKKCKILKDALAIMRTSPLPIPGQENYRRVVTD